MAKKPAAPASKEDVDDDVQSLLQDLAESEHHLRHRAAFAILCERLGYKVDWALGRFVVDKR